MTVFPRLFSTSNRWARRHTRRVEHRIPIARPIDPKMEYMVNMLDGWTSTTSTAYIFPVLSQQNVLIDVAKFISPTFYFEAVFREVVAGYTAYVQLYNVTDGVAVTDSVLSESGQDPTRHRSGSLALSGAKEYAFQYRTSGGTVQAFAVRIIVVDEFTTLTKLQHQVEVGAQYFVAPSAGLIWYTPSYPRVYYYEGAKFDGTVTIYFEAVIYVAKKTGYARLYNRTDSVQVTSVSTTATTPTRVRSAAITLTSGKEYIVQITNSSTYTTYLTGAKIIIEQTGTQIKKTQVVITIGYQTYDGAYPTWYQLYSQYLLDKGNLPSETYLTYYHQATFRSDPGDGSEYEVRADLYNVTDATQVNYFSTTSNLWLRFRSSALSLLDLKEYDSRITYVGAAAPYVDISDANIIIDYSFLAIWRFTETLIISDRFSFVHTPFVIPVRYFKENLAVISSLFIRRATYSRKTLQTIIVEEIFRRILSFRRIFREDLSSIGDRFTRIVSWVRAWKQNLSVIADKFSFVYTPFVPPVYKFVQNLSVISVRFTRVHGIHRAFRQDLSVLRSFFVRKVAYSRKFPQVTVIRDVFKRFVGFPRRLMQNLSILGVRFLRRTAYTRKLVQTVEIKDVIVRRAAYLRKVVEPLLIRAVFKRISAYVRRLTQKPIISDVLKRITAYLRVWKPTIIIEAFFIRRIQFIRRQVELLYVQVKAVLRKVKKWFAWLTRRMRLSIERPQHADFKL